MLHSRQMREDPRRGEPARVLLVHDGAPSVEGIAGELRALGLTVERVADAEAAVAAAQERTPALVLLVLRAAARAPLGALGELRRQLPRLPAVVLAEQPEVTEAVAAMQGGAATYL